MSQTTATFSNNQLNVIDGAIRGGKFDASRTFLKGAPVAKITATAVTAIHTLTCTGTPTTGSVDFTFYGETLTVAYNETATTLRAKLDTLFGEGEFTCGGGAWPGTPLTITPAKDRVGLTSPVTAQSGVAGSFDTGSGAIAVSTAAVPNGRLVPWDPTKIARPTTVPTVTATGSGGTFSAHAHAVTYTWYNANGETMAAPAASVTLTSGQKIAFAAISSGNVPTGAAGINVYVDGVYAKQIALSAGAVPQTDIAGHDTALDGRGLPVRSTAYTYTDGRATLLGFAKWKYVTDNKGRVTYGPRGHVGVSGAIDAEIVIGGTVNQADLSLASGTAAEAVIQLGARVLSGSVSGGTAELAFAPFSGVDR